MLTDFSQTNCVDHHQSPVFGELKDSTKLGSFLGDSHMVVNDKQPSSRARHHDSTSSWTATDVRIPGPDAANSNSYIRENKSDIDENRLLLSGNHTASSAYSVTVPLCRPHNTSQTAKQTELNDVTCRSDSLTTHDGNGRCQTSYLSDVTNVPDYRHFPVAVDKQPEELRTSLGGLQMSANRKTHSVITDEKPCRQHDVTYIDGRFVNQTPILNDMHHRLTKDAGQLTFRESHSRSVVTSSSQDDFAFDDQVDFLVTRSGEIIRRSLGSASTKIASVF
jgi:hypothetical protein